MVTRLPAPAGPPALTLRLATLATDEIAGPALAYGPELARVAADLGIGVSVDAVFGTSSSEAILRWAKDGILNPDVTLIHSTGLTPEAWKAMGETGTTVALAPTSDAQIGLETAIPAVDEALSAGIRPGLSIDVEVTWPTTCSRRCGPCTPSSGCAPSTPPTGPTGGPSASPPTTSWTSPPRP
ncbi:hypothetical protein ACFYMR_30925 [Streptomyces albogriseolus]|uniref:hypothetical protein n=1 Tax=Streptomyces albogriseolus TaxID=1887 RepID=UPI0036B3B2DA